MSDDQEVASKEILRHWWDGDLNGFYEFENYRIPVALIMKTGAGPTVFEQLARGHKFALEKWIGIEAHHDVFEIGCGIGRDAMWLSKVLTGGTYAGIDIISDSIEWCRLNIQNKHPNFSFFHFDVADTLHNPNGKLTVDCFRFPRPDNSVDRIFAFSVFTHMYANQIEHYLAECARIMRPGGRAFLTIFLYNDGVLEAAARSANTAFDLKFETEIEPGCRINNPDEPLGAIAYTWDRIAPLITKAGLKAMRPPLHGMWSGYYSDPDDGQDVLLLEK